MIHRFATALLACTLATGCAPAVLLDDPPGWPTSWQDRLLFTTPHAYIYAARDAAAGEADRLAAGVARDYTAETGLKAPRPLIIVRDQAEPMPVENPEALLKASVKFKTERLPRSDDERPKTEEELDQTLADVRQDMEEAGTRLDVTLMTMPLTCGPDALRELLHLPEAVTRGADGALILPTRECVRAGVRQLFDDACEENDVGPIARTLLAPALAIVEGVTVGALARAREVALFEYWLLTDPGLSRERKHELLDAYQERKLQGIMPGNGLVESTASTTQMSAADEEEQQPTDVAR